MIKFNEIPIDLRVPGQYIEIDNSRANQGLLAQPHKFLVIGQRLATGSVLADVPTRIFSADQGEENFGRGSMLAEMLKAAKAANRLVEMWAVALDDDGVGVQAAGTLTVTGPATAAGTINIYIAGQRVRVAVASGDADADIATAIAAAINAETDLPVTAGAAVAVVTATARHKGETGNDIDLRLNYFQGERLPAGVEIAIVAMIGGTANPDVATALAAIAGVQFHTIAHPYTDAANLTALEAELLTRWGPLAQQEGHAFTAATGTVAALVTLGDGRNSQFSTIMGAGKSPTTPWIWAAVTAAVDAAEPDPARPRQTLLLPGLLAPAEADRFDFTERDMLLHDGIATTFVDPGGRVVIERLITTYQQNTIGVDDPSYLDVTTLRTVSFLRFSVRTRIALKFSRQKLADDGTNFGAGQAIVTPSTIRGELIALFGDWEEAGLVEGLDQFKTELLVERDAGDPNRVNAILPPDIINQLRVFAAQVAFKV